MHDEYTILFDIHAIIHSTATTVYKACKLRYPVLCTSYNYIYLLTSADPTNSDSNHYFPAEYSSTPPSSLFFFFSQPLISFTHVPFQLSTFSHPSLSLSLFFSFFPSSIPYPSIAVFHQFHQHVWHDCCLRKGSLPSYVIRLQKEDSGIQWI